MIVLAFGGRAYDRYDGVKEAFSLVNKIFGQIKLVVHGGAGLPANWKEMRKADLVRTISKSADALAHKYALENGIKLKVYEADWAANPKTAGVLRNSHMLHELLNSYPSTKIVSLAFPGGNGTADMQKKVEFVKLPNILRIRQ
jgi:hypothetical protein